MAILAWLDGINSRVSLPREDIMLYERLLRCLERMPAGTDLFRVGLMYPPDRRIREAVIKCWILVTGDDHWVQRAR